MPMHDHQIPVTPKLGAVDALLHMPAHAMALFVFAHGAGAGMRHLWMEQMAQALGACGIATLRYQFPYTQAGRKAPDMPATLLCTVRAVAQYAAQQWPQLPLFAGGKSMGGRMTAYAEAVKPLGVRGLIFFGFPLHPPGKPSRERAVKLAQIAIPMLFLQGTRDRLADVDLIKEVCAERAPYATLHMVEEGDHGLLLPKRRRVDDATALLLVAQRAKTWISGENVRISVVS